MIVGNGYNHDSVDKWAFGIVLYHLLTGDTPWKLQKDERDTLFAIRTQEFKWPNDRKDTFSSDAKDIIS
jgi:serine/threonine protein kinase